MYHPSRGRLRPSAPPHHSCHAHSGAAIAIAINNKQSTIPNPVAIPIFPWSPSSDSQTKLPNSLILHTSYFILEYKNPYPLNQYLRTLYTYPRSSNDRHNQQTGYGSAQWHGPGRRHAVARCHTRGMMRAWVYYLTLGTRSSKVHQRCIKKKGGELR
jgi:hypothetical protein